MSRKDAARWRHEEQVQKIQLALHRRMRMMSDEHEQLIEDFENLDQRYTKLSNDYDELREKLSDLHAAIPDDEA